MASCAIRLDDFHERCGLLMCLRKLGDGKVLSSLWKALPLFVSFHSDVQVLISFSL